MVSENWMWALLASYVLNCVLVVQYIKLRHRFGDAERRAAHYRKLWTNMDHIISVRKVQ